LQGTPGAFMCCAIARLQAELKNRAKSNSKEGKRTIMRSF
jgi:hypothetical protein